MEKKRRSRSDTLTQKVAVFQNTAKEIELPEGVELRTQDELIIWKHFTRARARDAWRDFDLVLLAKAVRLEADIRRYQAMLDSSGPLIKNKRETLIENPLLRVIDTLQRQQLAIIRSMSLNQTGLDARSINDAAKAEKEAFDALKNFGAESLLASPIRH